MVNPARLAAIADGLEALASDIREAIADASAPVMVTTDGARHSWRSRLWTEAPDARMDMHDVAEALNRSRSWITSRLNPPDGSRVVPIPHRKRDGIITFTAGEVRTWWTQLETIERMGPVETAIERGALRLRRIAR